MVEDLVPSIDELQSVKAQNEKEINNLKTDKLNLEMKLSKVEQRNNILSQDINTLNETLSELRKDKNAKIQLQKELEETKTNLRNRTEDSARYRLHWEDER